MKDKTLQYLSLTIIALILFFAIISLLSDGENGKCPDEHFSKEDEEEATKLLESLDDMIKKGKIDDISDEDLEKALLSGYVILSKTPSLPPLKEGETLREGMKYFRSENTRMWPYYYYSQPYNVESGGGAWPPSMYTRLRNWSPGYYTTGFWQYHMRPGMGYKYWPRNRWVRHRTQGKNSYFYLGNGDAWTHHQLAVPPGIGLRYLGGGSN